MGNMQNMMRQAQKLQKQMEEAQKELNASTFEGVSAQNLVKVTFTGERKMTDISIDPAAIDPDDPDTLADLVLEAVNDGLGKIDTTTQQKMGRYTKGFGM
ncbi:YbaB/EbfC family nucleoid-associated protein [Lacticaseibacillus zhaodongensis]|uniref:YbaB/EbfC family nucleoid-associated protein n=1 Tax=Lacticaseibacillus zhaodongensis TaxID=2668065 RepID=UPI0012D34AB2|nr:YbaB/EbfC family nucleoid-associated protein [Lacticaseibacillus zhaodongensis]